MASRLKMILITHLVTPNHHLMEIGLGSLTVTDEEASSQIQN
ncbi:MAG: hypothetical protein ACOVS5_16670 [Oligoflexus sp.]|jgi:hypothetical protein